MLAPTEPELSVILTILVNYYTGRLARPKSKLNLWVFLFIINSPAKLLLNPGWSLFIGLCNHFNKLRLKTLR